MSVLAGLTLWVQGYPDQALERANEALTLAQNLEHPYTLARVLYYTTLLHQLRREWQMVSERAETAITVATAQQVALVLTLGPIMRGWALAMQGQGAEGLTQLRQGLDAYRATGAEFQRPHFLGMLAEVHRSLGQPEAGLTALREALTLVEKTGERYYEAELHRLKGELLLQHAAPEVSHAEACFQQALDIARGQQAKSLELRAAMSLGGCGSSRASGRRPGRYWPGSITGLPKALTRPTSRRQRHSCRQYPDRRTYCQCTCAIFLGVGGCDDGFFRRTRPDCGTPPTPRIGNLSGPEASPPAFPSRPSRGFPQGTQLLSSNTRVRGSAQPSPSGAVGKGEAGHKPVSPAEGHLLCEVFLYSDHASWPGHGVPLRALCQSPGAGAVLALLADVGLAPSSGSSYQSHSVGQTPLG